MRNQVNQIYVKCIHSVVAMAMVIMMMLILFVFFVFPMLRLMMIAVIIVLVFYSPISTGAPAGTESQTS